MRAKNSNKISPLGQPKNLYKNFKVRYCVRHEYHENYFDHPVCNVLLCGAGVRQGARNTGHQVGSEFISFYPRP